MMIKSGVHEPFDVIQVPSRVWSEPPHPSVNSRFKRLLDIVGALVGLGVLGLIFLPIAIAIKLDTPGAIFYKQVRFGYRGRPFTMLKFRSMVHNADSIKRLVTNQAQGLIFKNEDDPRITIVGKFLRRTSLDEVPQFWNVLRGEMSLVGTRPPVYDEVFHYEDRHWQRLNVKPGITGEWQVNGRSALKNFEDILSLDLAYQRRWTQLYDLKIIAKTIVVMATKSGAF
jgi:lipopolysaccharide/colanic/teichoic acid biosynthesis glycosyltransferase